MVPSRLLAVIGALVQTQRCLAGLRITGVIDGPLTDGLPKTIELYADTGIPDLSIYGVTSANNGNGQETVEYEFENLMVPAGSFLYLNQGNGDSFREYFELSEAETPEFFFPNKNVANINGDDAILLFENGVKIDAFGDNNVDGTGEVWEYLDGWAYRMSETDPSPTFILDNWDVENKNALDDTTKNSAAANGFPLGTYTATVGVNNDPVVPACTGRPSSSRARTAAGMPVWRRRISSGTSACTSSLNAKTTPCRRTSRRPPLQSRRPTARARSKCCWR